MRKLLNLFEPNFKKTCITIFVISLTSLLVNTAYAQWTRKADEVYKRAECNNVIYKNKIYMFGGFGDNPVIEKTNEVYDIAANKWSTISSFPAGKEITHQGIILVDDNVWLIGGRSVDAHGPVSSQVIIYNITTNSWSDGPQLKDPATAKSFPIGAGGYALLGRTIHVFGGFGPTICEDQATLHLTIDVDKYMANRRDVSWENKLAPMPIPRNHMSYVTLGGKIYVFGGQFKHDCGAVDQIYCHVYDAATDKWTRLTDLPKPRSHAEAATFAIDGNIFLAGGQSYNNLTQNTTYQFTTKANNNSGSWTDLSAYRLPGSFLGLSAKLAGNAFIIANGAKDNYGNERKETYIANVTRTKARTLGFTTSCISQTLNGGSAATVKNLLYCIEDETPYTLVSDASWLTVTKNGGGTATLNGQDIEALINAGNLATGNYTGKITATAVSTGSKASFCVNLSVTSSGSYTVTVLTQGSGLVTKTPEQSGYTAGSVVILNATAPNDWKFKEWTGDTSSTINPLNLVMSKSRNITAVFTPASPSSDVLISNIATTTGKNYQLAKLNTGLVYYIDRDYKITTVPPSLLNVAVIKTANDDKLNKTTAALSFDLLQKATVYVAYDPRATALPTWLKSWKKLTDKIGINDPKLSSLSIYSMDFNAGKVTIGGNVATPAAGVLTQYLVLAKTATDTTTTNTLAITKATLMSIDDKFVTLATDTNKAITPTIDVINSKRAFIYPNPVYDNFRIVFPIDYRGVKKMQILDINGKAHNVLNTYIKHKLSIVDVYIAPLALKAGLYSLLMLSIDGKTDVFRLIIN
jgi:hypothetical protein